MYKNNFVYKSITQFIYTEYHTIFKKTKNLFLHPSGVEAVAIHGGKDQDERSRAVEAFRRGEKDVLVATDVASKGRFFSFRVDRGNLRPSC